ncbi:MAG: hypothetical protein JRI68_21250 [Deltaproteobacteria bacterium]|nr:hypothetical protein [Deltaproteobacteria bacterium]
MAIPPPRPATLMATLIGPLCLALLGCADDSEWTPTDSGPPPDTEPLPPLPSTCTVPDLPDPLGTSAVVGDGTPANCTRGALESAVAAGGNITFDCGPDPHTIEIGAELIIGADTIIDGGGTITLDGQNIARAFSVDSHIALTVIGLTFVRGRATSSGDDRASGGAIRGGWRGSLTVFDCVFVDNVAGSEGEEGGGALYVASDSNMVIVGSTFRRNHGGIGGAAHNLLSGLTIVNSTFIENTSDGGGGAVYTDGASAETDDAIGGLIDICGCLFQQNHTHTQGGGAYLFAYPPDHIAINQCVFDRNVVSRGDGGGALGAGLRQGNATLQLANSLFVDNHSDVHGGGLWVDGNELSEVTNCTFLRNNAGEVGQEGGYGGAISGANLLITNVTIAENHAAHSGGAIFNEDETSVAVHNSIFSSNSASNEWGLDQSCRDGMEGSHNLQWPAPSDEDLPCTQDPITGDPLLDELADNGGPTMTMALLAGSPAVDAGQGCADTDQRGLPRADPCDLGAFEVQ